MKFKSVRRGCQYFDNKIIESRTKSFACVIIYARNIQAIIECVQGHETRASIYLLVWYYYIVHIFMQYVN